MARYKRQSQRMETLQYNKSEDELAGWDPRKEHYMGYQSSTVNSDGPLANFSRTANLARNRENVSEPYGLYIRNVPLNMKPENLQHLFSEYGKILSVYVRRHKPEQNNYKTTWAIIKVENMKDVLAMISGVNEKPPLYLKVELSLTEEERTKRRKEKEMDLQFQQEMEQMTASRMDSTISQPQTSVNMPAKPKEGQMKGIGRGKFLATMNEIATVGNANKDSNNNPSARDMPDQRYDSASSKSSDSAKTSGNAVVEIGCGNTVVGYRRPRPCVACGVMGQLRCSICKAWYCGKLCQVDDWFYHMDKCSPPPPLEDADSITSYLKTESHKASRKNSANIAQAKVVITENDLQASPSPNFHSNLSNNGDECTDKIKSKESTPNYILDQVQNLCVENAHEANSANSLTVTSILSPEKHEKLICPRKTNSQVHKLPNGKLRRPHHAENENSYTPGNDEMQEISESNCGNQSSAVIMDRSDPKSDEHLKMESTKDIPVSTPKPSQSHEPKSIFPVIDTSIIPSEQPALVDKVQSGTEYIGAILSNQTDYTEFSLTIMLESSEVIMSQLVEVLPSLPTDPNFKPAPGSLVAALSKQDETWYRAYVYAVEGGIYSVCYIDFFYLEEVEKVKALPGGPLRDFPGLSMIGKLHSLVKPDYQKELELLIVPDNQIAFQVIAKKNTSCKIGIKSEKTSEIIAYYILRSWYSGLLNHEPTDKNSGRDSLCENSFVKSVEPLLSPSNTDRKSVDTRSEVCQFVPHSVLVSEAGRRDGNLLTPNRSEVTVHQKTGEESGDNSTSRNSESKLSKQNGEVTKLGSNEANSMQHAVFGIKSPSNTVKKYWASELMYQNIEADQEYSILPIWVSDHNMLYVQIITERTVNAFGRIMNEISAHCQREKVPDNITVGELVCGFVSTDKMWYRCEVMAVDEKHATVHLCDFGNQEQILREDIRGFSDVLMREQRFCIKIKIAGISGNDKVVKEKLHALVESQEQLLMKLHGKEPLEFNLFDSSGNIILTKESVAVVSSLEKLSVNNERLPSLKEKPVKVQLSSNMQLDIVEPSVNEVSSEPAKSVTPFSELRSDDSKLPTSKAEKSDSLKNEAGEITKNATPKLRMYEDCKSTSLPISDNVSVVVLEVSSPHAISVAPVEPVELFDKLEELSTTLNKYCNSQIGLYRPRVGEMCLAKFSEDEQWYRAVCISNDIDSSTVFFVDYGNFENTPHSQICQIQDAFLELPCIALHCILKGISTEGIQEGAYTRLQELMPKNTPVNIKVVSHNEEDGTYIIDVPEVTTNLVAEGLVCKE